MESENFAIKEGLLLKISPTVRMLKTQEVNYRLCVPESMKADIFQENHTHKMAGHMGLKKTYERISQRYFWFGMYADIKEWVKLCRVCGASKGIPNERLGIPHSHIYTSAPFEVVAADLVGPLPITKSGNRWLLVFTDHFSKWVEVFAIPDGTAPYIAKHYVEDIICRFGPPLVLLTDRGNNLVGSVMTEINRLLDIKAAKTSPYHPQTNGLTERFNKTLCTCSECMQANTKEI